MKYLRCPKKPKQMKKTKVEQKQNKTKKNAVGRPVGLDHSRPIQPLIGYFVTV